MIDTNKKSKNFIIGAVRFLSTSRFLLAEKAASVVLTKSKTRLLIKKHDSHAA